MARATAFFRQSLRLHLRLFALLGLLPLLACATPHDLRPGPGGPPPGVGMLYPQPPAKVFPAALNVLPSLGLHLVEADTAGKTYILAERGINPISNGENVGIYLAPHGEGTLVTVVSRRKLATNITAKDFTMPVHMQLGSTLGAARKQ